MLNKKLALITMLFFLVCACGSGAPIPSPTNDKPLPNVPSPVIVDPTVPTVIVQPTPRPETESLCKADHYRIIPTSIFSQPDPRSQGFKYVLVRFAISNGSSYWGAPVRSDPGHGTLRGVSLTTEGGFVYMALFTPVFLDATQPPFTRQTVSSVVSDVIPPGFTANRAPSYWSDSFQLLFRVAQTQNHYTLTIPLDIQCVRLDLDPATALAGERQSGMPNRFAESTGPIMINLDEKFPLPLYGPDAETPLQDFPKSFEIPNSGTLEFLGAEQLEATSNPYTAGYRAVPQNRTPFQVYQCKRRI